MYTYRNAASNYKGNNPSSKGNFDQNNRKQEKNRKRTNKKKDDDTEEEEEEGGLNFIDIITGFFSSSLHFIVVWTLIASWPIALTFKNFYQRLFANFCYDDLPRTDHTFGGIVGNMNLQIFGDNSNNSNFSNRTTNNNTITGPFYFKSSSSDGNSVCENSSYPHPLGLTLGLLAVAVGQGFLLVYFYLRKKGSLGTTNDVQVEGARAYDFKEGLFTHLAQPEGFGLLGSYLIGTWMFGLMPSSYYSFNGGVNWMHVLMQLLCQDFIQYIMHLSEHFIHPEIYKRSHKPHHKFTNPRLFDAFNGSLTDTFLMILVPLFITAKIVPANVWSYMAFGSIYANWLTLIHSEFTHPWDRFFKMIGFGTAADHHVHHKEFKYNYGHLFMYWDKIFGTYKSAVDREKYNDLS